MEAGRPLSKYVDTASLVTIVLTLILFGVALVTKGFTHDLLLEAGVFLVSVKLILMSHKNARVEAQLGEQLRRIEQAIARTHTGGSSPEQK